jgi:hypothetical protein
MRRVTLVLIGALVLVGCNTSKVPKGSLKGTIAYKGQPINGGSLLLHGTDGNGIEVTIPVAQDGTFSSTEVPVGEYKVVVEPNPGGTPFDTTGMTPEQKEKMKEQIQASKTPGTIKFPEKYQKLETTDLTVKVAKGQTSVELRLND